MVTCRRVGAEADDPKGAAVKIIGADDDLGLPVRHPLHLIAPFAHRLDRTFHRFGAAVHRQHLVGAGQRRDLFVEEGQLVVVKGARRQCQPARLLHHRGQDLRMAVALIHRGIGGEAIEVAMALRVPNKKWSRGQVEARLANIPSCLIGMEACVGAHHLSRKLASLGHDARLMPAKYVRPYSKGQKNDFNDAEAIAEAVQRPTMKFVATKTVEQLDLQALHRVRERLISQRTGIINQIRAFCWSAALRCGRDSGSCAPSCRASWPRH